MKKPSQNAIYAMRSRLIAVGVIGVGLIVLVQSTNFSIEPVLEKVGILIFALFCLGLPAFHFWSGWILEVPNYLTRKNSPVAFWVSTVFLTIVFVPLGLFLLSTLVLK